MLLLGDLRPAEIESLDRVDQDPGDEGLGEPLVVGGDDVPRCPGRRGGGECGLEGGHVLVPARPLGDVGRVELPLFAGRVEPGEEALLLLLLGDVEEELHDLRPVPVEVALEGIDVLVALFPERRPSRRGRQLLRSSHSGMHSERDDLLVVRAVEDADAPALRESLRDSPEEVVVELLR